MGTTELIFGIVFRDLCPDTDLMTIFYGIKVIDNLEPDIFFLEIINSGEVLEMIKAQERIIMEIFQDRRLSVPS